MCARRAAVSMWVNFCENVYCRIAKILKIKITDIEWKDFPNPDDWQFIAKQFFFIEHLQFIGTIQTDVPDRCSTTRTAPAVELLLLSVLMLMDRIQLNSTFGKYWPKNENAVRKLLQSSKYLMTYCNTINILIFISILYIIFNFYKWHWKSQNVIVSTKFN